MNPRAAINDLLTFQASPFSHLGTSPRVDIMDSIMMNGEGGIRTHAPLRTNGFQDRLVMTTSIPLRTRFSILQKFRRFVKYFFYFFKTLFF